MTVIYLASSSARRQALLRQIHVDFDVLTLREAPGRTPDIDETPLDGEDPMEYVQRLARHKAQTGYRRMQQRGLPLRPVLGADTTVVLQGRILGKPQSPADAERTLAALSGRIHHVLTAVAIGLGDDVALACSDSLVSFRALTPDEIERYVASGEPLGKAGSYAIQGRAAGFVNRLEGSYSGVVGLPLFETSELLARFGVSVL